MTKKIIAIFLILQIFIGPFSQTVYGIVPSNEKKIVSEKEGNKPYHDHILDSIDRPDIGYIQGVTFRGLGDEDKDLFYKLIINDKVVGTLDGEPISEDKKRYVNFKKYNDQKPLYIGDKIELYIGNNTNDSFKQKVFEFGNVNSIALDILTPERISYSKDEATGPLRVNIVLNTKVPEKGATYSLINLTKKEKYPMHKGYNPEDGREGQYLKTDGITIQSQDEYVILSEFEDVEYYMYRMSGQDIMGVEDNFYKIQKSNDYGKVIGGKSNLYLETIEKYSKEQQYYFEYDDLKGAYKIKQKFTDNKLIYKYKENKITVEKIEADYDDQFWILEKTKSGKYRISSYYNKKIFLTINNNQIDIVPKGFQADESQEFELNNIKPDIIESKYAMISASNKNKLISVNPNTTPNNFNVALSDIKSYYDVFQQFEFKYVATKGAYKLINTYDNNSLVTWTSSKNNNVSMYADNEYDDQLWIFEEVANDTYIIASLSNPNRVLNVDANGVNISVAERYNTTKQQFILKDINFNIDGGKHLIKSSSNPLKVISNDDNNIVLKDIEELSIFQEFTFKYIENKNAYQIIHLNSGLAVSWASNSGGYNVMLYRPNIEYDDQLWNFEKLDDGVFTIYNIHNKEYVLNIDQDGKNISVAKRNNSTNQKFLLERISSKVANGNYVIRSNQDKSKVLSDRD
ncbi:MAG: RICIN domain-containing protein, partial [Oscillospiraceae bacterium]|nr:RICIN domain-containing protein [Oscillospiraceae bacterium]